MKSRRSRSGWRIAGAAALIGVAGAWLGRAELADYIQGMELTSRLQAVFFRSVALPAGPVLARRPPKETRQALSLMILAAPAQADLYSLRALEAERALDFAAAEADWRKYAGLAADRAAGELALADYWHRRLKPAEELGSLLAAGKEPSPASERLTAAGKQRAWGAFARAIALVRAQAMPVETGAQVFQAWIARYPAESAAASDYFDYLLAKKQFQAAGQAIAHYRKAFPHDAVFPIQAQASLESAGGAPARALAVYEAAFEPLWPQPLIESWFDLLRQTRGLRRFLAQARTALASNPDDIKAAARLFHYWRQGGNPAAALRVLLEYRLRKEARKAAWTAEELLTLARLFAASSAEDEAARHHYALYSLPGAAPAMRQQALAGIVGLLLAAPDKPIRLGSSDLSFYKDIATLDPSPGYLNGVLSLLLNSTYPAEQYANQERAAVAYFHRARAAELLARLDKEFPGAAERPSLHASLIEAYATYGDNDAVIRAARSYLASFPDADGRTGVSILMAEAFARKRQVQDEFATYDALLKELASRAGGVPVGEGAALPQPPSGEEQQEGAEEELAPDGGPPENPAAVRFRRGYRGGARQAGEPARSPEYARVLDRYIARLVSLKRVKDALVLYRREIDRNPADAGLYERLAAFLEQNKMAPEIEQVYRSAIKQFSERSWYQKLARWYLRRKQAAAFEQLSREVIKIFSGGEIEKFVQEAQGEPAFDAVLFRQVNLYANQRFPHNLTFVRNLLAAYRRRETANPAAWEALIRNHWFHAADLRDRFFEFLSATGRLDQELGALAAGAPSNPAATRFLAEGDAWRCHFEAAAPRLAALAGDDPGDVDTGRRAASLERSLGRDDQAITIEENLARLAPRDHGAPTRIGEIHAEAQRFERARPVWDRIPEIEPGRQDGYVETATIYWDYYLYDDALRWIVEARKRLARPSLFAYEAGAIWENRRDYARAAAEYLQGALETENPSSPRARLLELARRPAHAALIDKLTADRAAGPNPDPAAVALRVALLERQNRRADLENYLLALAAGATSLDLVGRLRGISASQPFDKVEERLLAREIEITADPVDRVRARLALVRYYEARQQSGPAAAALETLLAENANILGVVRAAADYYWRAKDPDRSVAVLTRAAAAAHPALARQFTLEAARKSTEAGQTAGARKLLEPLLAADPFHAEYLAAMADTFAREGNDAALRTFYNEKIQALAKAPFGPEERQGRTAELRRRLVPVLGRLKDFAGAVDQYIEILNRYPEDDGLAREAAAHAASHNLGARLRAYYEKAAAASPRDYRFPLLLARIETHLENYPAAVQALGKAIALRPERAALYIDRAGLEERLLRFDDAAAGYARLYELTYRAPQWMVKVAEVRARQGRADEAVKALSEAFVNNRAQTPEAYLDAAVRLDAWDLLDRAAEFAERGFQAGQPQEPASAAIYGRVMARRRQAERAFAQPTPERMPVMMAAADVVAQYYLPGEKAAFAAFLDKFRPKVQNFEEVLLPVVQRAGLSELEARWRYQLALASIGQPQSQPHIQRLVELQQKRMKFAELGGQMEALWRAHPPADGKDALLSQAAESYRLGDDPASELRVLSVLGSTDSRTFQLMAALDPKALIARAARQDAAVDFAVARGGRDLALEAVAARARSRPPVWGKAYTALAGLFYAHAGPEVRDAFQAALGEAVVGAQLGKPVDRNQRLAGDTWFYYGGRFGEYLAATRQPGAADYLPSLVEATPGRAQAYFLLAGAYGEMSDAAGALAEYAHTLELDRDRADALDRMAVILWGQGKRDEAAARWKAAVEALGRQQDRRRVPAAFWADAQAVLENAGSRGAAAAVREEADRLLRTYIRRNGNYRVQPLLRGALAATSDPGAAAVWIADLSRVAGDPVAFLASIVQARWVNDAQREVLYRRLVEAAANKAANSLGETRSMALSAGRNWRMTFIGWLLDTRRTREAQAEFLGLTAEDRALAATEAPIAEIRLAARSGGLQKLLDRYRAGREPAPGAEVLKLAAGKLREDGDEKAARAVLEFLYRGEIEGGQLTAPNFLGLAEVLLEGGDTSGAVAILRRLALVVGEPFGNLEPAGALLVRTGHPAEAVEFLARRVQSTPWDAQARLALSKARQAAGRDAGEAAKTVAELAASPLAPRAIREAARGAPVPKGVTPLLAALAADPEAAPVRLALHHELRGAGRDRLAVSAMLPFFEQGGLRQQLQQTENSPEPGESDWSPDSWWAQQFLAATGLSDAERGAIARGLAASFRKLDELPAAAVCYRIAVQLIPASGVQADYDSLKAELKRRAENDARRPMVADHVEQDRLVRPRVTAAEGGVR